MIKGFMIFAFILVLFPFDALADESMAKNDEAYLSMVDQSMTMPEDFDFMKLRDLYTKTSFYRQFPIGPKGDIDEIVIDAKTDQIATQKSFDAHVRHNFAVLDTHMDAEFFIEQGPLMGEQKMHQWASAGILEAIMRSGDGLKPKSAIQVIDTAEIKWILKYIIEKNSMEISRTQPVRPLQDMEGKIYSIVDLVNYDTHKTIHMYFDVTMPLSHAQENIRSQDGQNAIP